MSMDLLREKCFDPPKMWHVAHTKPNPLNFPLDTATPLFLLKLRSKERVYFVRVTIKSNIIGIFLPIAVFDRRNSIPIASLGDKSYQVPEYSLDFHKQGSTRPVTNFGWVYFLVGLQCTCVCKWIHEVQKKLFTYKL